MSWILLAIALLFPGAPDPEAAAREMLSEHGGAAVQAARDIVCANDPDVDGCE